MIRSRRVRSPARSHAMGPVASLLIAILAAGCAGGGSASPSISAPPASLAPGPSQQPTPTPSPRPTATPSAKPSEAAVDLLDIPGSRVRMRPPAGFVPSSTFPGFQHDSSATIIVAEIPGPYLEMATGMTSAALKGQGITETTRADVQVDGRTSLLIEGTQAANGVDYGKVLLITGTPSATAIINAIYPQTEPRLRDELRSALLSASFDPTRVVDPSEALRFTFTPQAPLRLGGVVTNTALYNVSGLMPSTDPLEPVLIVGPSLVDAPVTDVEGFARQRLAQTALISGVTVSQAKTITIDGIDGIELVGTATHQSGKPVVVYQVLLVNDDGLGYVLMSGRCLADDRDDCLAMFRASASTYAAKP